MVQTEKLREEFAQRLAQACKDAGLDEHGRGIALSRATGLSSKGVSKWLNAESLPRPAVMAELAKFLKVDPVWLQLGIITGEGSNVSNPRPYTRGTQYPVISKVQAGAWNEAIEAYSLKDIDQWLESDAHIQGEGFWLLVDGDSMTAPMGLSIPEGTFVLFDTGKEATNGKLVIAKLTDANEATFKKLVIDGNQKYLKGLNPAWPMVPINGNCRIIGVAVETKFRLP
ncbi:LexA family protein [Rouxiella badensis]|jgi:SOS-response transcriptional repressor LexA|uniref:LexA family transcriptional repressor n=1 Tax=Rouxiella badensis TaxID=1646377 RepID=A0A1X0WAE8_9GAMM|nr:S24 family peptidase [Rouxiella badensis]MCC3720583.1 helix-turn-helix domain-containing protein [Rouxiella badensis]MCC3730422.1 helix-turn-helix domain-containing protein [Rouxiella badensis]MCC3734460.1 helix-turn-helix domain-containing protein [Rouxiella badensis]MCC3742742.1 helix-turn-helix domain-containing protein [Rouxiella badensis]MCC3759933.1 helix-turn-helix domain-containing protein [Rouxiella badensis]